MTKRLFIPPREGQEVEVDGNVYHIGEKLGQGGFGRVYECADEWENELVAKVLVPNGQTYEQVKTNWYNEIGKLLALRHPNITYIYNAFEWRDTFYLIIERCDYTIGGLLRDGNHGGGHLILPIARCVLQAVAYMHRNDYVHKDIHAENVFVSFVPDELQPETESATVFKVGDLGISKLQDDIRLFGTIMAPWMLPPEHLNPPLFGQVGKQTDLYHVGMLLLNVLLGQVQQYSKDEVLGGEPRNRALANAGKWAPALEKTLRRRTKYRTKTAMEFWTDLCRCMNAQ